MKSRWSKTPTFAISKSRWLAYATAGAATLLTGRQLAEGAIHYSGRVDVRLPRFGGGHATFQLDRPGHSILFEHRPHLQSWETENFAGFKVNGGSFRGTSFVSYAYVSRLRRGDSVAQGLFGVSRGDKDGFGTLAFGNTLFGPGYFLQQGIGYIGFSFRGAEKRYGWARVRMLGASHGNAFEILDYAYADPGEKIKAGQISSDGKMVELGCDAGAATQIGSLGLLAAGATGLLAWRAQRKHAA
ncbi:MAG TPA: hypothetical protein VGG02_06865 [Chthoniobacterales bacterium]|jgi:hypothetical protein